MSYKINLTGGLEFPPLLTGSQKRAHQQKLIVYSSELRRVRPSEVRHSYLQPLAEMPRSRLGPRTPRSRSRFGPRSRSRLGSTGRRLGLVGQRLGLGLGLEGLVHIPALQFALYARVMSVVS